MSEAEQDKRPEPESVETDDELESLSPEEKAAFEKIMAEISAANGGDDHSDTATDDAAAPAPAASSSDEIAPSVEDETPSLSDEGSAGSEDGLSEDQSDQLDKIMAEIEGKRKADHDTDDTGDDAAAEADEAMSEDQQAAMDKIMAEIEGKRKADHDTDDTGDDAAAEADEAMSEDQQAALDKIMAEIEGKRKADRDTDDTGDDAAVEADEAMSEDQQAALDKIMADIGSKRSRDAEAPLDEQADEDEAAAEAAPSQSPDNLSMDEFDDELSNLLQNAESNTASPAKQAPKKVEAPASDNPAPAGFAKDKEINAALKKIVGRTGNETRDETPAATDEHQPEVAPNAYPILHEVPVDGLHGKAAGDPSSRKRSAKSGKRTGRRPRRWLRTAMVASAVLALLSGVGYWGYDRYVKAAPTPSNERAAAPASASRETAPAQAPDRQPAEPVAAPVAPAPPAASNPPALPPPQAAVALQRHAEASFGQLQRVLATVRSDLQNRISDIQQLKSYYAAGIAEEIEKIENALQSERIPGLEQALGNTRIELALRAIQRRDNYIAKLDKPLARLSIMSEELLFMERRARIHEILERGIHGLPLDRFRQEARTAMTDYEKFSAEISIDAIELPPKPLGALWKEVSAELTKRATRLAQRTPLNRAVSAEICNGNFDRKYMLTALSVETAGCLVRWTGKDLYLNELTELTPEAAEVLTQWPGEWLSFNGIKELTAETARHLAQWPGKRLSLNGLTVLSPEATTELSQWQGDQLEMVGLTRIGRWQNYGTRLYLSEQLKRRLEAQ